MLRRATGGRAALTAAVLAAAAAVVAWLPSALPGASVRAVAQDPPLAAGHRELVRREAGGAYIILAVDAAGDGHLYRADAGRGATWVACERLEGAFGLWLDDIDGDRRAEALVALRKKALFDPVVENRLHVYGFEQGRCVPAWRGTRLNGRFDDLSVEQFGSGRLLALERIGEGRRRVARYRWAGFGYVVEAILWQGRGAVPAPLDRQFKTNRGTNRESEVSGPADTGSDAILRMVR